MKPDSPDKDLINAAFQDTIAADDLGPGAATAGSEITKTDIEARGKKRIKIFNSEGPIGSEPVFVAVNGRGYHIPRETVVEVPIPVISVLENAAETQYYREYKDGVAWGPILEKQVRRFNFAIID